MANDEMRKTNKGIRCGLTLVEMLAAMLLLSFMVGVAGRLYAVGNKQQQQSRVYSQNQQEARTALRTLTRTLRHGFRTIVSPNGAGNLSAATTDASNIIVEVPEPGGGSHVHIRFYLSGGTLYSQRQDEASPGTRVVDNVQSMSFKYWQSFGAFRTELVSGFENATDVEILLVTARNGVSTSTSALVGMRNSNGLF